MCPLALKILFSHDFTVFSRLEDTLTTLEDGLATLKLFKFSPYVVSLVFIVFRFRIMMNSGPESWLNSVF